LVQVELSEIAKEINYLIDGGSLHVGNLTVQLEPVLVCDMKALVQLMGLYTVYHPSTTWKCPWCHVCDLDIADFSIPCWPFRNHKNWEEIIEDVKKRSESGAARAATDNGGVKGPRIFGFDLFHIIPCMLHCIMAIVRKMLRLTLS